MKVTILRLLNETIIVSDREGCNFLMEVMPQECRCQLWSAQEITDNILADKEKVKAIKEFKRNTPGRYKE